jgi:hypothetical protein
LTYSDIMRVLERQRQWFTRPEKQVLDHLVEYLGLKLAKREGRNDG